MFRKIACSCLIPLFVLGCGDDEVVVPSPPPQPDGLPYNCFDSEDLFTYDELRDSNYELCIDEDDVDENPNLVAATCIHVCKEQTGGDPACDSVWGWADHFYSQYPKCDPTTEWASVVDENLELEGFACQSAGSWQLATEVDGGGQPASWTDQSPLPAQAKECAINAAIAPSFPCEHECVWFISELFEMVPAEQLRFYDSSGVLVDISDGDAVLWAYCLEVSGAVPDPEHECETYVVADPRFEDFQWSDGRAPLDCSLNGDCDFGRPTEGSLTGTVSVSYGWATASAPITGRASWSAPDCRNPAGSCPFSLDSIQLEVAELDGTAGVVDYYLDDLSASLAVGARGAWRTDTEEVFVPREVVRFDVLAGSTQASDGSVSGTHRTHRGVDAGLSGTLSQGVLGLSGGRTIDGAVITVDIEAR